MVPARSSTTSFAPRAATAGTHGRRSDTARTTRPPRSRNSTSIGKRMNSMVMLDVLVIRSASPCASRLWSSRPMPRVRMLSAVRQSVARMAPRVRLRSRAVLDATAAAHRRQGRGREDDDEQRREDTADRRQHDEDRGLGGLLLGALAALLAHLLGLDPQDLGHGHAELVGLDDRRDEVRQLLLLDAIGDPTKRLLS